MFLVIAALTCAVLIPIDVVYNLKYVNSGDRNYLLMLTMSKVGDNWLWCVAPSVLPCLSLGGADAPRRHAGHTSSRPIS